KVCDDLCLFGRLASELRQTLRLRSFGPQSVGPRGKVRNHGLAVELRVELDAPSRRRETHQGVGLLFRLRQSHSPRGQTKHRIEMSGVYPILTGFQERRRLFNAETDTADLAPRWVAPNHAAQGLRQHLMPETDAQRGYVFFDNLAQVLHPAQHPW